MLTYMVNKHDACENCVAAVDCVLAVIMGTELTYSQQSPQDLEQVESRFFLFFFLFFII